MSDFDFNNLEDLKAEEKRLYDEYKAKLAELKRFKKKRGCWASIHKRIATYICSSYIKVWSNKR